MRPFVLFAVAWVSLAAGCGFGGHRVNREVIMNPAHAAFKEPAPAQFKVVFETSAGSFTVAVDRSLAPAGADRFYNLARHGFYNEQRFFRVVPGFVVQWGMHGDPQIGAQWQSAGIADDPVRGSNKRGTLCFAATQAPNSRTTQIFVNLGDNAYLDAHGFAPFGTVVEGLDVVEKINAQYGEKPDQMQIRQQGNSYLQEQFPALDYIREARVVN